MWRRCQVRPGVVATSSIEGAVAMAMLSDVGAEVSSMVQVMGMSFDGGGAGSLLVGCLPH